MHVSVIYVVLLIFPDTLKLLQYHGNCQNVSCARMQPLSVPITAINTTEDFVKYLLRILIMILPPFVCLNGFH